MSRHFRSTSALLAFVLLSSSLPRRAAHAQETRVEGAEYREVLSQAVAEFDAGRFAEAKALFERAHALEPTARTFRALGMCAFEMRDYSAAVVALEQALVDPRRPLGPEQREDVERLLASARAFAVELPLELEPGDAELTVDRVPATVRAGKLLLNPGPHDVRATAEGFAPSSFRLVAERGRTPPLRIVLEREAPAASAPAEPMAEAPDAGMGVLPGVITLGAGGAVLVVSLVQGIRARSTLRDYDALCARSGSPDQCLAADAAALDELADDFLRQRNSAWGLLAGGVAAAGAGAALLVLGLRGADEPAGTTADLACSGDGCTVFLRGRF